MACAGDTLKFLESIYPLALGTHREEKIHGTACLLANPLLKNGDPEQLNYSETDHSIRALDALSCGAISLFATTHSNAMLDHTQPSGYPQLILGHSCQIAEFSDSSVMRGLVRELNSWSSIALSIATVPTQDHGNAGITLTLLGARFREAVMLRTGLDNL